jgi:hypothetical protein
MRTEADWIVAIAFWWDVGLSAFLDSKLPDPAGVVAAVSQHRAGFQTRQQFSGKSIVMGLPRCQRQPYRKAIGIHERMNLAGQSARDRPIDCRRFLVMHAPCCGQWRYRSFGQLHHGRRRVNLLCGSRHQPGRTTAGSPLAESIKMTHRGSFLRIRFRRHHSLLGCVESLDIHSGRSFSSLSARGRKNWLLRKVRRSAKSYFTKSLRAHSSYRATGELTWNRPR